MKWKKQRALNFYSSFKDISNQLVRYIPVSWKKNLAIGAGTYKEQLSGIAKEIDSFKSTSDLFSDFHNLDKLAYKFKLNTENN